MLERAHHGHTWLDLTHYIGGGGKVLDDDAAVGTCLAGLVGDEPCAETLDLLEGDRCSGKVRILLYSSRCAHTIWCRAGRASGHRSCM